MNILRRMFRSKKDEHEEKKEDRDWQLVYPLQSDFKFARPNGCSLWFHMKQPLLDTLQYGEGFVELDYTAGAGIR